MAPSAKLGILIVAFLLILSCAVTVHAQPVQTDVVFMIDGTVSMGDAIAGIRTGIPTFVNDLASRNIDARFAVVIFGYFGQNDDPDALDSAGPELLLDFTSDATAVDNAVGCIVVSDLEDIKGSFQRDHTGPCEPGLEVIRMVLGESNQSLDRTNVGGTGNLAFRPTALKNLILITDEDSDLAFHADNRFPGQVGRGNQNCSPPRIDDPEFTFWQAEIDATAQAVLDNRAFLNLVVQFRGIENAGTRLQYSDARADVPGFDPNNPTDVLNFDREATLANLDFAGLGNSLQAQVMRGDPALVARCFDLRDLNNHTTSFVTNFFEFKIREILRTRMDAEKTVVGDFQEGGSITYTIRLTNNGGSDQLDNPTDEFEDVLPSTLTLVSADADRGVATVNVPGNRVAWNGTLSPSESVFITIAATINSGTQGEIICNQGRVFFDADGNGTNEGSGSSDDPTIVGLEDPTCFEVGGPAPFPVVTGEKIVSGVFDPETEIIYTITLTNNGTAPQPDNPGDEFSDVLPPAVQLVSADANLGAITADLPGNRVAWNGALLVGESVVMTIRATILAGTEGMIICNQGTILADTDLDGSNETSSPTDDPGAPGADDPTCFRVSGGNAIPTQSELGLLILSLLLGGAIIIRTRR